MSILSFFTSMTEPLHCEEEVGTEEGVVAVEEAVAVEEEEEEEPEDLAPGIRESCAQTKPCAEFKHHFDHCSERVLAGKVNIKGEDCVEELFHFMHCVDDCSAKKPIETLHFLVITDSLLQPGLQLINHFISTAITRHDQVILVALEHQPSRLPHPTHLLQATNPYAHNYLNLTAPHATEQLQANLLERIQHSKLLLRPITVVLDSLNVLYHHGAHSLAQLVHATLAALATAPKGSRLIALHHADFPVLPSPDPRSDLTPSLLPLLLSPSLSSATIHLTLHPVPLIELLSREYGLSIPLSQALIPDLDVRLTHFLSSFSERSWGNPLIRPTSFGMEDERVPLDLLGGGQGGQGGCAVEWVSRGVVIPGTQKRENLLGAVKKLLTRGLEGIKRSGGSWEMVPLREVVNFELMRRITLPSVNSNPTTTPVEPSLPFNLSLTESQRAAREELILPYLPKEGGTVEYVPDEGDDFDDDDPDEDLEI